MTPSFIRSYSKLLELYKEIGDTGKAIQLCQEILSMDVKIINSITMEIKNEAKIFLRDHTN